MISVLSFALTLVLGVNTQKSNAPRPCVGLKATLQAEESNVRVGAEPNFVLSLRNGTKKPIQILDIRKGRRPDLETTYFDVVIERQGSPVSVPRPICDPGPISAADFFQLDPGITEGIHMSHQCLDLTGLQPGRYEAHVSVWLDPYDQKTRCDSSEAWFVVFK
jgi:hypothetical protein